MLRLYLLFMETRTHNIRLELLRLGLLWGMLRHLRWGFFGRNLVGP